jgi:hypothetical protein
MLAMAMNIDGCRQPAEIDAVYHGFWQNCQLIPLQQSSEYEELECRRFQYLSEPSSAPAQKGRNHDKYALYKKVGSYPCAFVL